MDEVLLFTIIILGLLIPAVVLYTVASWWPYASEQQWQQTDTYKRCKSVIENRTIDVNITYCPIWV